MIARRLSLAALLLILAFDVWSRGHTIGPTIRDLTGLRLYPVVAGETEPLDCDEAIYAFIGKRIAGGSVMYKEVTENKPPGGYWLYAATAMLGGGNETGIRVLPIPFVLATIALVWWVAGRVAGPIAAVASAMVYALMSTDPYVYGNGANMEHFLNFFSTAGLASMIAWGPRKHRGLLFAAGAGVGAACLIKQVGLLPLFPYLAAIAFSSDGETRRSARDKVIDAAALLAGVASICGLAAAVIVWQGAGPAAYEDIFRYGRALATDTPPDLKEKPFFVRWLVGNTDPEGRLPWPFGATKGRAWWAAGSYPLWAASVPAWIWLALGGRGTSRRLVAAWTLAAWVEVAAPGLFWQHYYLLPLPGVASCVGVALADALAGASRAVGIRRMGCWVVVALLGASVAATAEIQRRDYLMVAPERLTVDYKGGAQWVELRKIGRELRRKTGVWFGPRLFVWGIQSPLYIYGDLYGATTQVFTDPLTVAFLDRPHPLIGPRLERTLRELEATHPDMILIGERPFPGLMAFVGKDYVQVPLMMNGRDATMGRLYVRGDRLDAFLGSN